jgi:hypothetical protein
MDTDFFYAGANNRHWLPIAWFKPSLNSMELETSSPAGFIWEISEVVQARSYEF